MYSCKPCCVLLGDSKCFIAVSQHSAVITFLTVSYTIGGKFHHHQACILSFDSQIQCLMMHSLMHHSWSIELTGYLKSLDVFRSFFSTHDWSAASYAALSYLIIHRVLTSNSDPDKWNLLNTKPNLAASLAAKGNWSHWSHLCTFFLYIFIQKILDEYQSGISLNPNKL